ncbi:MAG: trypsin-like peptidase domain-containing protein [Candidatus Poribacteria bacterium]|nr:trypsin-like peptidase domain-containing protein [Candidatus Poribacteria bacterium]MDE0502730.1 trypsin-like peptidase domain-containing protein [Candidatus Poribacteria bacterium]
MKNGANTSPILALLVLSVLVSTCNTSIQPTSPNRAPMVSTEIELLESMQSAFVNIYDECKLAVVSVSARNVRRKAGFGNAKNAPLDQLEGTGIIFRSDGYIVTNDHVVNGAETIRVRPFNRQWYDAELIGEDASTDIAVLKIDAGEELPTLSFADSDEVRVGQFAIAIGNPFGLDFTITTGIVSGIGRALPLGDSINRYQDFIQTDAWLSKGNSGGPLLNIYGKVIGLNSVIRKTDDAIATDAVKAGASFAIPINLVKRISDQLVNNRKVTRGWLGVRMSKVREGIRIRGVIPSSPAERGGLQRGDIITLYKDAEVAEPRQLQFLIAESLVGEKAEITILRNGQHKTVEIAIGEIPPHLVERWIAPTSVSWKRLGLAVRELGPSDFEYYAFLKPGDQGIMVKAIKPGAPAYHAGILRGTLIVAINGVRIESVEQFDKFLLSALDIPEMTLEITHSEGKKTIDINPSR